VIFIEKREEPIESMLPVAEALDDHVGPTARRFKEVEARGYPIMKVREQ
jgi:hypothetical protein